MEELIVAAEDGDTAEVLHAGVRPARSTSHSQFNLVRCCTSSTRALTPTGSTTRGQLR